MQAGVLAFVVVNMDSYLLQKAQGLTIGRLEILEIRGEDVVGLAGRNPLCELTHVVGIDLPLRLFIFGAADLYGDAVHGMIVRSPDGSGNQRVRALFGFVRGVKAVFGTEAWQQEQSEQDRSERQLRVKPAAEIKSSHRLRFPLPLRRHLPRSPLPLVSIQAGRR